MNMNTSLLKDLGKHKYFFLLQICGRVFEYLVLMRNVIIVLEEVLTVKKITLVLTTLKAASFS